MNPLTARRKGIEFEQRLVRALGIIYGPTNVRRNYQCGEKDTLPDITAPGLAVEAKCGKNPPYYSALQQAIDRGRDYFCEADSGIPFAAFHINGQNRHQPREFLAMLRLEDLLRLLAERSNHGIDAGIATAKAAIAELHRHPTKKQTKKKSWAIRKPDGVPSPEEL